MDRDLTVVVSQTGSNPLQPEVIGVIDGKKYWEKLDSRFQNCPKISWKYQIIILITTWRTAIYYITICGLQLIIRKENQCSVTTCRNANMCHRCITWRTRNVLKGRSTHSIKCSRMRIFFFWFALGISQKTYVWKKLFVCSTSSWEQTPFVMWTSVFTSGSPATEWWEDQRAIAAGTFYAASRRVCWVRETAVRVWHRISPATKNTGRSEIR